MKYWNYIIQLSLFSVVNISGQFVQKQANSKDDPSAEVEHIKRMFARQRAKDLAEHARIHMEKDNELEKLREELASLSDGKSGTQVKLM